MNQAVPIVIYVVGAVAMLGVQLQSAWRALLMLPAGASVMLGLLTLLTLLNRVIGNALTWPLGLILLAVGHNQSQLRSPLNAPPQPPEPPEPPEPTEHEKQRAWVEQAYAEAFTLVGNKIKEQPEVHPHVVAEVLIEQARRQLTAVVPCSEANEQLLRLTESVAKGHA